MGWYYEWVLLCRCVCRDNISLDIYFVVNIYNWFVSFLFVVTLKKEKNEVQVKGVKYNTIY